MGISVEYLKNIRFSQLSPNEKLEIKTKGRPTPGILIQQSAVSKNKTYIRTFNNDWYEKMKWLCGCELRNALFCFPCLLYGGDTVWTETGFTNIGKIKEKCEKHQNSRKHMENVVSLSLLGQFNISGQLSELYNAAKSKHNEQVKKNREVLSKMIDCLKFCGDFNVLKHGQHDSDLTENLGVFKSLINFLGVMDPSLQKHLENSAAFRGSCKAIQNELLQNMLKVCQDEIATEIEKASYVAVIAENTTEVSEEKQLFVIFRYELNGVVHERFWGFLSPDAEGADDVANSLIQEINMVLKYNPNKLIAHTYYRPDVIKGENGSVQQQIQKVFENAHFTHSYTHQPHRVISEVCSSVQSSRLFFANLSGISSFFSKHPQKLEMFDNYVSPQISKAWSTRWNFNSRAVTTVFENKENLIKYFQEMQSLKTTNKITQASTSFLALLRNETFLYWLELFRKIIPQVEILYNQMQSRNIDEFKIQKALDEFVAAVFEIRNSNFCESGCFCKVTESKQVCDRICEEARQRFSFTHQLIVAKFFYRENFEYYNEEFPVFEIEETCQKYTNLVKDKLITELKIFYSRKELHNFGGLLALLNFLIEEDLPNVFTETIKLLKILITIPMTTAEPERCFSLVKKIKMFLNNCEDREQLTALAMISLEKQMISRIKNFNEKVIEKFCTAISRRMDFTFK